MADAEAAKLPTVPETLLKKRKARSELRAKQIKSALLQKKQVRSFIVVWIWRIRVSNKGNPVYYI